MKKTENSNSNWTICPECQGLGKKSQRLRKKVKIAYQKALDEFEMSNQESIKPIRPKNHLSNCQNCSGSGLISGTAPPLSDHENYPHVAIIGGGIGGVALAVACLHRGIPFTIYERDNSFDARSQGYGLTLQQASKAIEGLGLFSLKDGLISTRHVVHNTNGKIIGEWGNRKWMEPDALLSPKRTNIHIARQALRLALIEQLGGHNSIQWGHQLLHFEEKENTVELKFEVGGEIKTTEADLLIGADGIRSAVRKQLIGEEKTPLRYLDCIVILGICPLKELQHLESELLDSATVFQTANGNERIYVMPFSEDKIMWQLSFPMSEIEAEKLSNRGVKALKEEAKLRTQWHVPIPQIIAATHEDQITGYPVYDREILNAQLFEKGKFTTLIGDAAHPMSPFKGQGANQALLDALSLARGIAKGCRPMSDWKSKGIRKSVLTDFESEMLARSAKKVKDSAEAAQFLHSEVVLHEGDEPRGRCLKN